MTDTDVAVVGGGATGVGVARDLAMRGVDVTLLERGGLAGGTTGRSHYLLHSGARYADRDPESAVACASENAILRRTAGACVAETGGLFVKLARDDGGYFERKLAACREAGVPARVLDGEAARARVPGLAPAVERAIAVPDAVVSPARLVAATAESARRHGARVRTDAPVTAVDPGDTVTVTVAEGRERLDAAHLVNAAGAWAGRVAALAGATVEMRPSAGAMAVVDRPLARVVNRCRPPDDGDIVVPLGGQAILGTTSRAVADPDDVPAADREPTRLLEECAAMVPGLDEAGVGSVYRGVRPLYAGDGDRGGADAGSDVDSRSVTRGFAVLDHAERDGVPGLTTVVGGKLTTHRVMAAAAADEVCRHLGVEAPCRTAVEALPRHADPAGLDDLVAEFAIEAPAGVSTPGRP